MAAQLKDLTGQRFGRRLVLGRADKGARRDRQAFWLCRCTCGAESVAAGANLRAGIANSCGCLQREGVRARFTKYPAAVVERIRELRKGGLGYDKISQALGVPKSLVRDVIKGRTRADT